ncbi:50S ribosomal protein L24 [Candidatus Woesearchaeota archaeon]|nr:50S ribosomal protein L24 [Candidatus Woesearchaeota archaeon]
MKEFSIQWRKSIKARKKTKYAANAPLHIRRKMMAAHLSKELRTKYKRRSFPVRKGDTVKVMAGQFRNKTGKITQIDIKHYRVFVENAQYSKRDGTKVYYPMHPSKLMLQDLNLEDKMRIKALERNKK